jgi:molybdenum cofactor biosynthesis protein MoaC
MIDVSPKFNSLRYAKAEGYLYGNPDALARVADRTVPKGDVLEVARAAGILAAKRCSDMIVFCHPIPLDWVEVNFEVEPEHIRVIAEVRSVWKTGVEVEAITAVTGALLNAYDMLKPLDTELSFGGIKVLKKRGGKSNFSDTFSKPVQAAVLVLSDSTHAGTRKDKSGLIIKEFQREDAISLHNRRDRSWPKGRYPGGNT